MVISPYDYVFKNYYEHENVVWVPYSCALEGCAGYDKIEFNAMPKLKILQLVISGPATHLGNTLARLMTRESRNCLTQAGTILIILKR
jgi:hypothetical protein